MLIRKKELTATLQKCKAELKDQELELFGKFLNEHSEDIVFKLLEMWNEDIYLKEQERCEGKVLKTVRQTGFSLN